MVLVAVQLSVPGLYLPPVFKRWQILRPRRSFHCRSTLRCDDLGAAGALVMLVAVQLSVLGSYLPPVLRIEALAVKPAPDDHFTASPHCRVRDPEQQARWWCWWLSNYLCWDCISRRCSNSYCCHPTRPRRSFRCRSTLRCDSLGQSGALVVLVAVQLSVLGLYLPPVFK